MAMPLDPEPKTLFDMPPAEPFVDAPDLRDLAEIVLARYDEFRDVNEAVRESELVVTYVWDTKPFDPEEEVVHDTIAKVTKAPPLWRCIARTQLVIQFRMWWWEHMDARQREAVVFHEFMHVVVGHDDKTGDLKLKLRDHDIEEFGRVMRRFGAIVPGRQAFIDQYLAWERAQDRQPQQMRTLADLADDVAKLPVAEQAAVHAVVEAQVALDRMPPRRARRMVAIESELAARDEIKTSIRFGDGPEMPVDLDHPSDEVQAGMEQLVRGALGIPKPCPFPECGAAADHEGDHDLPAGQS